MCFRAACGCRGVINSRCTEQVARVKKVLQFKAELSCLNEYETQWLMDKFLIEREWLAQVRYCEDDGRVYYPQWNRNGSIAGYIARYYSHLAGDGAKAMPKALWKGIGVASMGLYFPSLEVVSTAVKYKRVCLVEDYPSALRINSQVKYPTLCLGGTNIYEAHVKALIELGIEDLTLVLDADAVVKAVKLKRGLSLAFNSVKILPLTGADPKDMTLGELDNLFESVRI